jgi:hypothetical protein
MIKNGRYFVFWHIAINMVAAPSFISAEGQGRKASYEWKNFTRNHRELVSTRPDRLEQLDRPQVFTKINHIFITLLTRVAATGGREGGLLLLLLGHFCIVSLLGVRIPAGGAFKEKKKIVT